MTNKIKNKISAKAFFITSNHPDFYYPEWITCELSKATKEDYVEICKNANKQFYTSNDKKHSDLNPKKNGAIAVCETGDNGNLHIHQYVYSHNGIKFNALQNKFPHSHIEIAYGSFEDNLNYFKKEGKHKDKAHTTNCDLVYWGILRFENRLNGEKGYFSKINARIANGATPKELFQEDSKNAHFAGAIKLHYLSIHEDDIPSYQKVDVYYHFGESGSGKTYEYKLLCDKGLKNNVHIIRGSQKNKWDKYNPLTQNILFIDNLETRSFKGEELLLILDNTTFSLDARYEDTIKNWNIVHITSVQPPENIYISENSFDSQKQFLRRLNYIVYHYVDNSYPETDSRHYKKYSINAKEYTNYVDLKNLAMMGGDLDG